MELLQNHSSNFYSHSLILFRILFQCISNQIFQAFGPTDWHLVTSFGPNWARKGYFGITSKPFIWFRKSVLNWNTFWSTHQILTMNPLFYWEFCYIKFTVQAFWNLGSERWLQSRKKFWADWTQCYQGHILNSFHIHIFLIFRFMANILRMVEVFEDWALLRKTIIWTL